MNDGATNEHVKNLLRVIKFAIDTKDEVLVYKIEQRDRQRWELRAFSIVIGWETLMIEGTLLVFAFFKMVV